MKITVIGMLKNSADVIETFIRANALYADNFILIDNGSTDRTNQILKSLQLEGFQIDLFSDPDSAYFQSMRMNLLIQKITREYDVDWIIPLDDDEILASNMDGVSVRDIISALDTNTLYYANWRLFVPTEEDNPNEICVAKRQTYTFSDKMVTSHKVIFHRDLASLDDFRIVQGNHDIKGIEAPKVDLTNLFVAHYPVRSVAQITSKALVGWTNYLALPIREKGNGDHWKEIYDLVKNAGDISIEQLWMICLCYSDCKDLEQLEVQLRPLNIDSEGYKIAYTTPSEINPFMNYLYNTENIAKAYAKLQAEHLN